MPNSERMRAVIAAVRGRSGEATLSSSGCIGHVKNRNSHAKNSVRIQLRPAISKTSPANKSCTARKPG